MTQAAMQVDFYVLRETGDAARFAFAARLCEKAYRQHCRILILMADPASARAMSDRLWAVRPEAFVPHTVNETDLSAPVCITCDSDHAPPSDVLINLTTARPPKLERFRRLAEIVTQDKETLATTRQHYSFYKSSGFNVNTHKLEH